MSYTLKRYSSESRKRGFYIDHPNHTFQSTIRADRFFRKNNHRHGSDISKTIVKSLVLIGDAYTEGGDRKPTMGDWVGKLHPNYCEMSDDELERLRSHIISGLEDKGLHKSEFEDLDEFVRNETEIRPIEWREEFARE